MPSLSSYDLELIIKQAQAHANPDEELRRLAAAFHDTARDHGGDDEDLLGDLDMTAIETDEEILEGLDDVETTEADEAVVECSDDPAPEVVSSAKLPSEDVIQANFLSTPVVNSVNRNPAGIAIPVKVTTSTTSDRSTRFPQIVKSVRGKRVANVYRDAAFMRDLQGLLVLSDVGTLDPSSVSALPLLTYPLDTTIFDRRSKQDPWWLIFNGGQPHPKPARQFRKPAAWRDVSDTLHVHYLHLGLKALGPVHGFTLLLSHAVEAQARAEPDALGWLTARIKRHLKDSLGRSVEFYCVAEEDDASRLHLHGEFNIVDPDAVRVDRTRVKVRKALRLAGGEWPKEKGRQRQAQVKADAPDAGWSGYLAKDFAYYGPIVRPMLTAYSSNYAPGFKGDQVSRTKGLGEIAGKIYGEHRALVVGADKN